LSARCRLPNRRASENFSFEVGGLRYTCSYSRFADGRIGEVFLSSTKPSSQSDCNVRDSAIAASLALQWGCPVDDLRRALQRDSHGNPSSPLGKALDIIGSAS
jgi:hypothetical protein